jgi:uncharacterized protein
MTKTPAETVAAILNNPKDIALARSLCAPDVTYVSLNYEDRELKRIMPWCGTSHGPEAIVQTFIDVGRYWTIDAFEIEALFDSGENVAVFGRFTYTSTVLSKTVTSPFSCFAKVRAAFALISSSWRTRLRPRTRSAVMARKRSAATRTASRYQCSDVHLCDRVFQCDRLHAFERWKKAFCFTRLILGGAAP